MNTTRKFIVAEQPPSQTLEWLDDVLLPDICQRLDDESCRKRLGLYSGERIPENERNLTDVRNRVSLILEYEFARVLNDVAIEAGIDDAFVSYVVANRFPDLEVREDAGGCGLRIEMKCLQTVAEEASANFDALLKDIDETRDYVVVLLWEWDYVVGDAVQWDRAPRIQGAYVFHARSLAIIRDHYWLSRPPSDPGSGVQGFDLRYAITSSSKGFKQEEGNYGKLLRIWDGALVDVPQSWTSLTQATLIAYVRFQAEVRAIGFESLKRHWLPQLAPGQPETPLRWEGSVVGSTAGDFAFVRRAAFPEGFTAAEKKRFRDSNPPQRVIEVNNRLQWRFAYETDSKFAKPKKLAALTQGQGES